jgi:SAM-dependent methyltransferase
MNEFERWEARFAAKEYVFGTAPNAFLERQSDLLIEGKNALSIADGEGRNGVWLAERGLNVTAQDFSPTAQDKARHLANERGVTLSFEQSDLSQRSWRPDHYDVVVGIFFQFLSPVNRKRVFSGIIQTVKPGGIILIEGYGPKQLDYGTGGPKKLKNLYTEDMLRDGFGRLSELNIASYDADISEGAGHSGLSAIVDLIGRK